MKTHFRGSSECVTENQELASLPPRGWNSYDSFDWIINEKDFLQNAELVSKRLRAHGYEVKQMRKSLGLNKENI